MAGKRIARLCKTYKLMSFAVFGAHGCPEGMAFGEGKKEGDWLLTHQLYSEGGISRAIRKFIQPGAPVVLSSCEAGKGEFSPEHALQLLGFHAFGPDRATYGVGKINADFSSGKLKFSVVFQESFGA